MQSENNTDFGDAYLEECKLIIITTKRAQEYSLYYNGSNTQNRMPLDQQRNRCDFDIA